MPTRTMTFNGRSSADPAFGIMFISRVIRPVLTANRTRYQEITGRDGVYDQGRDRDATVIRVSFPVRWTDAADLEAKSDAIAAWLDTATVRELIFSDRPGRRYMARRDGPVEIIPQAPGIKKALCEVEFTVPAGYAEAIEQTINFTGSGTYSGTLPAPIIITLTAAAGSPLTVTQEQLVGPPFIRFIDDREFTGGEEVVIDTGTRLVTVDGVDARADVDIDSDFENFKLHPGEFVIGVEGGSIMSIVYRERFI